MNVRRADAADLEAALAVHRAAFSCSQRRRRLYDWAFQVAVLDADAELPRGRVVYPPTFAH